MSSEKFMRLTLMWMGWACLMALGLLFIFEILLAIAEALR